MVDGQQIPVQTQLVERNGSTSVGRDAAAIGTTTGVGAAIGAAAGGGVGAGIGAGAGLVVSTVGVLLTRGNPTILRPETVLTFKIEQPVVVSTEHAPHAFRYVDPSDYQQAGPGRYQAGRPGYPPPGAGYGAGYGPGYAAYGPGLLSLRLRLPLRFIRTCTVLASAWACSSGRDSDTGAASAAASADGAKSSFNARRALRMRAGFHTLLILRRQEGPGEIPAFSILCVATPPPDSGGCLHIPITRSIPVAPQTTVTEARKV